MQQVAERCQLKNISWNCSMACRDTKGLLTAHPIQVECISSLCSLLLYSINGGVHYDPTCSVHCTV